MELRALIKVEAFPYMDVAIVRVLGTCSGGTHGPPTCDGHSLITQVSSEELERLGVSRALCEALIGALEADPDMEGFLMH